MKYTNILAVVIQKYILKCVMYCSAYMKMTQDEKVEAECQLFFV